MPSKASLFLPCATAAFIVFLITPADIAGKNPVYNFVAENLDAKRSGIVGLLLGAFIVRVIKRFVLDFGKTEDVQSIYGLQHGRLHLRMPTSMWMNMGYWKNVGASGTMAEACRDLLNTVLAEAWFSGNPDDLGIPRKNKQTKCLIDLGFGCGDQTVYLLSTAAVRPCDETWWDQRSWCVKLDQYMGITKDSLQARYALERVDELKRKRDMSKTNQQDEKSEEETRVDLFCANAADPEHWNEQIQEIIRSTKDESKERWVLALDTAYHFAPSRWPLLKYTHNNIDASFMAFDLCLSYTATRRQKILLRVLTALMGAPWANFVTPKQYHAKLVEAGYRHEMITITDISEHVFTPLAEYLEQQDKRLKLLGLGIGSFSIAKTMFSWWGRTGVVRGVIVVARK